MTTGKQLWKYAMRDKKLLIIGISFLIIAVTAELAAPFIGKKIIDEQIVAAGGNFEVNALLFLLGLFFVTTVIASIFRYGESYTLKNAANRIIQKMRNDVYQHIQTLPIKYFDNLPAGKVVARITNDTESIQELYVTVLSQFVSSFITIFGIYVALFLIDWKMAMLALIVIPLLVIWVKVYRKFAAKYNHVIREKNSEMNAMINESIQGMTIIQAFRRENQMEQEFEKLNDVYFRHRNKMLYLDSLTSHNLVTVIRSLVFVFFIAYFGKESMSPTAVISVGALYAFVDYISRLFNPITGIVNQLAKLEQSLVAAERVFELLHEQGEQVSDEKIDRYKGNVQFDDVYFAYDGDDYVLKNISFEAKQGETIALVGHTGSGKSSMMNLLFRFYDVTKGAIKIDGMNILNMSRQTIRDHMGIVLQDPYLFTGTVASNVSLDDSRISREKVAEALDAVGGDRVLKHLPLGLDEPVVEKGSTLSSGQRQIISFARALAFDPAILILDEATSNIDTETEEIIQHAMDVLKKGRTTFIIAHRLSTVKNADKIIVLHKGEIVEQGTHDELIALSGRYEKMYRLQAGTAAEK